MRVLFATAELRPIARVGGLAEAAAGLVRELRRSGVELTVVVPDYGDAQLESEDTWAVDVPDWVGEATARRCRVPDIGEVILVSTPGMARPHPYVDPVTGEGWPDNDHRFFGFSSAVASLTKAADPDVLHLNDWHTAATLGFLAEPPPTMLTIHTLGYQGVCSSDWIGRIPVDPWRYAWYDATNPLLGAIRTADTIVAVSPRYATEILDPAHGMGLDHELARRGEALIGIRNGIDVDAWNPATDEHLPVRYDPANDGAKVIEAAKREARQLVLAEFGLSDADDGVGDGGTGDDGRLLLAMVTRLVDQKGVDLALGLAPFLENLDASLLILGSGQANLVDDVQRAAATHPGQIVAITDRYDEPLAHTMFAGVDLFLMPSRFEPCGLAQMQAMAYGTIPVATAVGGLVDTIIDGDLDPKRGTGFLSQTVDPIGVLDAVHRAARAHRATKRRRAITKRGMAVDWSWNGPALQHIEQYEQMVESRSVQRRSAQNT